LKAERTDVIMDRPVTVRILAGLALLGIAATTPASSQEAPREVLEQYCELDAQGEQLTPDGWKRVAPLFVAAAAPRWGRIIVIKDSVVSHPNLRGDKAEFYVEYIQLGQIDSSHAKFSPLPPAKVRAGFDLVLTGEPRNVGLTGEGTRTVRAGQWRIEGSPPEPHLTVDAALRYATDLRDRANDELTRRNADRAIRALKGLRPLHKSW
jgi:hypothetical protein